MSETYDMVREHFVERFRSIFIDPRDGEIALPFALKGACWWVSVRVDDSKHAVTIVSHCPVLTPADRHQEMCEYNQRCQNRIIDGHFKLDFNDGEVLFCTSLFFGGVMIEAELVGELFDTNVTTVRRYLPGMMAVAYGDISPAEAVSLPVWPERLLADELDADLKDLQTQTHEVGASGNPNAATTPDDLALEALSAAREGLLDHLRDLVERLSDEAERGAADVTESGEDTAQEDDAAA